MTAIMEEDTLGIMENGHSSVEDLFRYHRQLIKWTTKDNDGYLHPNVRIAHSPEKGFHMVVAEGRNVQALTRITSSPMTATLSVLNALNLAPFSSHGSDFPATFLRSYTHKPELLQTFFLMEQFVLGDKSWWAPYIKTLPTLVDVQASQFDTREDQIWLEGTNLKAAFVSQATKWQELYTKGLRDLKIARFDHAIDGSYSWDLFRWAATIFGSRSFTSEVLSDTEPAEQARLHGRDGEKTKHPFLKPLFVERFAVLLPLLDILNHRPIAQVEWQARSSFVGMQILSPFTSGEELCNNYGPRDNESLLLSYGFTITSNPFDHVAIALKPPPPGSPLAASRINWKHDIRSTPDYRSYIFSLSHPRAQPDTATSFESALFSYDLLDALSILKGNDRELQIMYNCKQSLMSWSLAKPHKFEDFRNLLATLAQLHQDCRARKERLSSTYPRSMPLNSKQAHAKIYRDSQLSILETATAVCEFVLVKASSNRPESKILADLKERNSEVAFGNLNTLLKQHTVITKSNELLSVDKMLEFLPEQSIKMYRSVKADIEALLSHPPPQPSTLDDVVGLPQSPLSPTKRKRSPNQPMPDAKQSKPTLPATDSQPSSLASTYLPLHPATISTPFPILSSHLDLPKMHLSVLLSLSLHLFDTGIPLPHRLITWLTQLTSRYPPDDENWSYVPTDGPWGAGEEPPLALVQVLKAIKRMMEGNDHGGGRLGEQQGEGGGEGQRGWEWGKLKWLKPEMICWGWNVMEEEGVLVSRELVGLAEGKTVGERLDTSNGVAMSHGKIGSTNIGKSGAELQTAQEVDFLLYCKQ